MRDLTELPVACASAADRWLRDGADRTERPTQVRFVLVHLACAGVFLAAMPVTLVIDGAETLAPAFALFACIATGLALLLLRSGSLYALRAASVVAGTGAATWLSLATGAAASPFAVLLALPLLEASLMRDRKMDRLAAVLAFAGLSLLGWSNPSWALAAPLAVVAFATVLVARQRRQARHVAASQARANVAGTLLSAAVPDVVGVFDTKGLCLDATAGNGVLPLELTVGRGFVERVHLQDRVAFLKLLDDATRSTVEPIDVRVRDRDIGGGWRPVTLVAKATAKPGLVGVVMRAPRIEAKARQVPAAQRQLLANMSHELRTPLNAIIGFSDVLQQGLFGQLPTERHREYVGLIKESGEHLLDIITSMLDAARLEAGRYELSCETFDFADVASSAHRMLEASAGRAGIELVCDVRPTTQPIEADPRACRQVLINLMNNAIKFTGEGGRVELRVRRAGPVLRVSVIDTGIGIAPDDIERLGEPFLQLDSSSQRAFAGTGLGLSVVRGLVSLHGGTFDISSVEGKGTTMAVTLPLVATATAPQPDARIVPGEPVTITRVQTEAQAATPSQKPSRVDEGDDHVRLQA